MAVDIRDYVRRSRPHRCLIYWRADYRDYYLYVRDGVVRFTLGGTSFRPSGLSLDVWWINNSQKRLLISIISLSLSNVAYFMAEKHIVDDLSLSLFSSWMSKMTRELATACLKTFQLATELEGLLGVDSHWCTFGGWCCGNADSQT